MKNIFSNPTFRANIGYNGFDMSCKKMFSSTTGELLPVYYDLLQPGDKVSLNTILKTRTMELQSAAMAQINEHLEWFFVPMTQIYSAFGDFYYQINDLKTSLMDPQSIDGRIPFFSSQNFLLNDDWLIDNADIFEIYSSARLLDWFFPFTAQVVREGVYHLSNATGFCPIFLCAYQKIYMDFYRDSNVEWNSPTNYNLDRYYSNNSIPANDLAEFTQLRYRLSKKDYYTNTFVSPLFSSGDVSSFNREENNILNSFRQWLVGMHEYTTSASQNGDTFNGTVLTPTNTNSDEFSTAISASPIRPAANNMTGAEMNVVSSALSPSAIRTSFAVQKLLEVTRRAGKHYDKQTLAHFGVDVPTGISGEVMFLGGSHSVINIGDVIATATGSAGTATSVLGQVGGKGYGYSNGKDIKFTAPCHGILMCLYSADVENNYDNCYVDRLNLLMSRADWFTPEYDNLGMQPLFRFETPNYNAANSDYYQVSNWQYRYSELKCKRNTCYGAMSEYGSLGYWTTRNQYLQVNNLGKFMPAAYHVSPHSLDSIMLVPYNPSNYEGGGLTQSQLYGTDPLIHELYFDVKKSSKMSTYGLEQL